MTDPLFPVLTNFYIGAFQTAISEASHLTGLSQEQKVQREIFTHRAYIEIGSYDLVLSEIADDAPLALRAVKLLASYLKSPATEGPAALEQANEWAEDLAYASNATVLLIAAMIFALEGNVEAALKVCHAALSLEMMALSVQVCLRMDRPDAAGKVQRAMSSIDDDAPLTQLAAAWVALHQGGAKVQEAYYIFQELGDKFSWTVRLHNGLAACQMRMGRWEDAEAELLQAFEKNPKDTDTLANLVVVSVHLGKTSSRYLTLLRGVAPAHSLLTRTEAAEAAFDRAMTSVVA